MKVSKVSTRPVFAPEEAPQGDFPKPESALQESAFFAAQVRGIGPLKLNTAKAKLKLRKKVEASLTEVFKVPALIDGLTDYLAEVVNEDSQRARLLGI
ncbi:hypothetical protein FBR05_00010 [Deltaproteobacteria bacterium PRO3]|nr:hypothetical protein [Deltaproteobacteria bacterium PRO3]